MRFTHLFGSALLCAHATFAGLLPSQQPHREGAGRVAAEAEDYHALRAGPGMLWTEAAAGLANPRGGAFLRALPDGNGTIMNWTNGPAVDYRVEISTPGTYRLWLRWAGTDLSSDSIFAGLAELADGAGSVADWYQDSDHSSGNFDGIPWDGSGGFEENTPTASQNPMTWNIATPGVYTLRIVAREDGVALDAWLLQLNSLPDPAPPGPPIARADSVLLQPLHKVGLRVLRNDTGPLVTGSVAIVQPPAFGSATPRANGTILYEHTAGSPENDAFSYRVSSASQTSAPAPVTITFTNALRLPHLTAAMPPTPPPTSYSVVDALPGVTFASPTSMDVPIGETNRLYVAERGGRVWVVPDLSAPAPTKELFLDLSDFTNDDGNELGMKGLAFHPGFLTNRHFYVTYCAFTNGTRYVRLSRYTADASFAFASPTSEVRIINLVNDSDIHNINDVSFGPDGYLYLGLGDEGGNQSDSFLNSQTITKDFWSALLRLDVDKKPGSQNPSHHTAIVAPTNYAIPPDNPFLGATQFNGAAVNTNLVRTEFFAVGFRNPWQFSFDSANGTMWAGDVGLNSWEEINVITGGGNYGWAFFEGNAAGARNGSTPPGFTYTRAVWTYPHGNDSFSGYSVTAGLVCRSPLYPELLGRYLCADYVSGNLWSIERTPAATNIVRITGEGGLVQFGLHPASDEILLLDHGDGRVRKLVSQSSDSAFPQTLSDTGFFADLTDLSPNPGVVPYSVNLPFWSDYAIKQRWFSLTSLGPVVHYAAEGNWSFPTGMLWVKHFDLEQERGQPASRFRVETRVLVRTTNGAYGVSYLWNTNGTEAYLVPDAGISFDFAITNNGQPATQSWSIPSRAQCLICHTPAGGHALSFNTRQLNRDGALGGHSSNYLALLQRAGYVTNFTDDPLLLPRHVRPDETQFDLEVRARSYLAVNCGYCHQQGSASAPASWDARPEIRLADTRLINGVASSAGTDPSNRLIVAGDLDHSIIFNRVAVSNGFTRMPPLATAERDPVNIQLLADWITQHLPGRPTYAAWRQDRFGSTNSPAGEPGGDPDEDNRINLEEYLAYTDPQQPDAARFATVGGAGDQVTVSYALPGRDVRVEASTNLLDWFSWSVPGNNGLPLSTGSVRQLQGAAPGPGGFFRFQLREP
jgi:glucose/arabinose dehydrogenase/mono/diheme cytochrome c family protein